MKLKDLVPPVVVTTKRGVDKHRARKLARRQLVDAERLNLGCGDTLREGWANIDLRARPGVVGLDLTWGLPVAEGTIETAYIEHMLEEIAQPAALAVLRDVRRTLKPGGVLRISTPDLAVLISEYVEGRCDYWEAVGWSPRNPCDMVNEGLSLWGNRYLYDRQRLEAFILSAGFSEVQLVRWGQSDHRFLRDLETRADRGELIVEATK